MKKVVINLKIRKCCLLMPW